MMSLPVVVTIITSSSSSHRISHISSSISISSGSIVSVGSSSSDVTFKK